VKTWLLGVLLIEAVKGGWLRWSSNPKVLSLWGVPYKEACGLVRFRTKAKQV
ncbi:hypothetical protein Droror1_Dr00010525, partial [Drosera rotundifolia]